MKRVFVCLLLSFVCNFTFANEIWSFNEFAFSGKHADVPIQFPNGGSFDVGAKIPYIIPGPVDNWAGNKEYTYSIVFDSAGTSPAAKAYELKIQGWAQGGSPPVLKLSLNGCVKEIATTANAAGDRVLTNPKAAKPDVFRVLFPADAVKKEGNKLEITTKSGSWLVFDSIQFLAKTGNIEKFSLTPIRGVFKGENGKPVRKAKIEYGNEILAESAILDIGQQKLTPENNLEGGEIFVAVADPLQTFDLEATLTLASGKILKTKAVFPAEKPLEIHLIHQTHLDIGYTHTQEDVLALQVQSIRDSLKYIEETRDYPPESQFRFHPEGMWAIEAFWKTATDAEKAAFVKAAQERRFHLDAMYAQAMTGMYNEEELLELLAASLRFGKEHNIPIDSVMQTDVPGYTWGLVTALAESGIKYMTMGPNGGHRVGNLYHWGDKPFYWESQSGKEKVLCWLHSTGYHQFHRKPVGHIISDSEIFSIIDGKDWLRPDSKKSDFPYSMTILRYGIERDNGRPNRALSDAVKSWNEKYVYPKLIISTNSGAMAEFERRHGKDLPTLRGDYTPYWEDGCISTTEATSINRRSCEKILQAQTLWAMLNPTNYPVAAFDEAYTDLIMYDEHTWGAHNSISEPESDFVKSQDEYKQQYARRGAARVDALIDKLIPKADDSTSVIVYNTTTRERADFVTVPWNTALRNLQQTESGQDARAPMIVAKSGNDSVPCQITENGLMFYAGYIPPIGSKQYKIESDKIELTKNVVADPEKGTISNGILSLKIDPKRGAIVSLKRKGSEHDFVNVGDDGNAGLNDYLYILGRDAKKIRLRVHDYPSKIDTAIKSSGDGFVMAELVVTSTAPNCNSFERIYRLYAHSDRMEIINTIDKKLEYKPEGTFFGFPFNVPNGKWLIDTPFSSVEIEKDQLPGANRNYYCLQRYALLANDEMGIDLVSIESNMYQFSPILLSPGGWGRQPNVWRESLEPNGTIYSWVCNNHWETNYKAAQEGKLTFRYILCPYFATPENAIAQHIAREWHQPLLAFSCEKWQPETEVGTPTGVTGYSGGIVLDNGSIVITSCRAARDKSGDWILRLFNPTDREEAFSIKVPHKKQLFETNPLEEKGNSVSGDLRLPPKGTIAIRASLSE